MEEKFVEAELDERRIDAWIKQLNELKKNKSHEHLVSLNKCEVIVSFKPLETRA